MKKFFWILCMSSVITTRSFAQIGWWTSSDTLNVFNKNKGAVLIGSYQPLGKLTVGPDDKFYNLSLVGDYNNLAKNYLQIGVTGRGFENLQGQTIFDLYHSNTLFKNAGYNFRINGQSQFFINGEGNIGIGTEKPEAKLDLSGGPNWGGFNKAIHIPINHAVHFDAGTNQFGLVAQNNELNVVLSNGGSSPFGGSFAKLLTLLPRKMIIEGDIEVRGKIYSQGQVNSGGGDVTPIESGGGTGGNGGGGGGKGDGVILPTLAIGQTIPTDSGWVGAAGGINYPFGNVGIGSSTPAGKLDVRGSFSAGDQANGSSHTFYMGATTPTTFTWQRAGSSQKLEYNMNTGTNTFLLTAKDLAIGTASANTLFFYTGNGARLTIDQYGTVGIGITNPDTSFKLSVNGKIKAKELYLTTSVWPDFVFEQGYNLRSLRQVENYIKKNGRLPEIPSQKEVEEKGVGVIEMQSKLLQKIEELTVYVIEQNKKIEKLEKENAGIKKRLSK